MKLIQNLKKLTMWCVALALVMVVSSCDNDDNSPEVPTENIVSLAQGNPELTSLVSALTKYPNLVATLQGGEFTVFAPTNYAFDEALEALGQTSIDDLPESVLRNILGYHVIPNATLRSTDLTNSSAATEQGEEITINVDNGVVLNGSSNVIIPNVDATNGIVHVIDEVLLQPSVRPFVGNLVGAAYFNRNFTTLIDAVLAASPSVLNTLLSAEQKTLFAPTNDAFTAAGITSLPDRATLDAVLTYHLINGSAISSGDIADGSSSAQTAGGTIFLSNNGSNGLFINGTTEVVEANLQTSNGIIHVIDRTLMPTSQDIADIAIGLSEGSNPEFTQLVAALSKVPTLLQAAQDDNANLTVFAPTDAAFQSLYSALQVNDIDELVAAIGTDKLAEVLQHHIVGSRVFSTDLSSGMVPTLNQELNVETSDLSIDDASGTNTATLQATQLNILALNGVIHVIDAVLIPEGIL